MLDKLVFRKAGTGEEEENLAREQVGQCSCSLIWCVFVWCRDVLYFQQVHLERVCFEGVCECVQVFLHVCRDGCVCVRLCVCVTTAGQHGGSTAGRRCALQSASPRGTG